MDKRKKLYIAAGAAVLVLAAVLMLWPHPLGTLLAGDGDLTVRWQEPPSPTVAEVDRMHEWQLTAGTPAYDAVLAALAGYNYYRSGTTYLSRGAEVRNVESEWFITGQSHTLGLSRDGYILVDFSRYRMRRQDLSSLMEQLTVILADVPEKE